MSRWRWWLETLRLDVRHGLRHWRREPGFTILAVLVLALGIGANLAIFGLFDALVLQPLNVGHPGELVAIDVVDPKDRTGNASFPLSVLQDFERRQSVFSDVAGYSSFGSTVDIGGTFSVVGVASVTERYFDVLQVRAAIGRLITAEDLKTGARVAVLTDEFWRRWYARDPHVLGTVVELEGVPFTIVGVSVRGFGGLLADDPFAFTVPISAERAVMRAFGEPDDEPLTLMYILGRSAAGQTIAAARSQVQSMWPSIRQANVPAKGDRETFSRLEARVKSFARGYSFARDWWGRPLGVSLGATLCLLVVACVNLASLTLARTIRRQQEIVVRVALGAPRRRLVQQKLVNSLLVTLAGTVVAVPLASWGGRALMPFLWMWDGPNTSVINVTPDWRVAVALVGTVVVTAIVTGIGPAIRLTGRDVQDGLQRTRATTSSTFRGAELLLVVQIASSVVLLVGAAMFSTSLARLRGTDLGLLTRGVSIAALNTQPKRDTTIDPGVYSRALVDRLMAVPGVRSVGFAFESPMLGIDAAEWRRQVASADMPPGTNEVPATFLAISPDYLGTMGVPLQAGRDFRMSDDRRHSQVAVLSSNLAHALFPGKDAIGRYIRLDADPRLQHVEVIGVSRDASLADIHAGNPRFVFLPLLQASATTAQLPSSVVIRSTRPLSELEPGIRHAIESLGQHYVVQQRTLTDQIKRSLLRERLLAIGGSTFAAVATVLIAIGLCGVIGDIVAARTREIGIRAALGASAPALYGMVLLRAARVALLGVALGLPCAWMASRWVAGNMAGMNPHDPRMFPVIAVGVVAVAVGSAWPPARRAAGIDPIVALRAE